MPYGWDHDQWVKAWGRNAPLIVGGVGDELFRLPAIPANYNWTVIREIAGPPKKPEPAYLVSLGEIIKDDDRPDNADWAYHVKMLAQKQITSTHDLAKTRELVESFAAEAVEKHVTKEK